MASQAYCDTNILSIHLPQELGVAEPGVSHGILIDIPKAASISKKSRQSHH